jgi:type VI secretion system secreted protein VgrG
MADTPSQDGLVGRLATPLAKDKLCLVRFEGTEAMGELFEFRVEAVSMEPDIDFEPVLGQNCSVHFDTADNVGRDFSGILTEARWVGVRLDLQLYRLVLRPWPWLMSLSSHCRIYSNMNVKDIIKEALGDGDYGPKYGPIIDLMVEDYPELEYTVQYRETDLNFAFRLMEKYGIYYYFKFDRGDGDSPSEHYLVLADSLVHEPLRAPTKVTYLPPTVGERRDIQQFNDWSRLQGVVAGIFHLNDFDYNKPEADLLAYRGDSHAPQQMPLYDYPGGYDEQDPGFGLAQVRFDAEQTRADRCSAGGYAPSLTPGYKVMRTSPDGDSQDGEYLILRCGHWFGDQSYATAGGPGASYSGTYELSRSSIPYRMPLRTRRPVIVGSQPAKVVSKKDQEIDVDGLGRVLLEFYWDDKTGSDGPLRKGRSRRVRVGQFWAGAQRGALYIPRVGDEVMVAYEDGDPDRPIIVGSVYNGNNKVPSHLPERKTHSGILTQSSPKSGAHGYNMLLFEDAAGHEFIKLRSQKDLMFKALANEQRDIGGSQTENVGGDETITVGGAFTVNAGKTITLNVGPGGAGSQIVMDGSSITLSVGPGGGAARITMSAGGVFISATPASNLMVQPGGIATNTPRITFAFGPVTFVSPMVTIPLVTIGAGTVGGLPII